MNDFRYSEAGLALTKRFEGLRLNAYQDINGIWTIGYGHTGKDIVHGRSVTPEQADALLRSDVAAAVHFVNDVVKGPLNQNRFDALVDFTFNVGRGSLLRSQLLTRLNEGNLEGAADGFADWIYAGHKIVPALMQRRIAEANLFREPIA
jgi:lysozyme